jgi:hypothetical protein
VTNNQSFPITNTYGYLTNYASQLSLTSTPFNLYYINMPAAVGLKVIVKVWVKLGTATKAYTSSDGLNATTYTQIEYTFAAPSNGLFSMHVGSHGQTITQQTNGTVFVYGWQIFVADGTTTFSGNLAAASGNFTANLAAAGNLTLTGYAKSKPVCFYGRQVDNTPSSYTAGQAFKFTSLVDPYSCWTASTNVFTVPVAGYYRVNLVMGMSGSTTAAAISVWKSAAAVAFLTQFRASSTDDVIGNCVVQLAAGDVISIAASAGVIAATDRGTLVIQLM